MSELPTINIKEFWRLVIRNSGLITCFGVSSHLDIEGARRKCVKEAIGPTTVHLVGVIDTYKPPPFLNGYVLPERKLRIKNKEEVENES